MLETLDTSKIIEKLRDDEHYYGDFGKQFLSNSDLYALLNNPKDFRKPTVDNIHLLRGAAFHTMMLEPEKWNRENFPVIETSSRLTKVYKTAAEEAGKMLLLPEDLEMLTQMEKSINNNDPIQPLFEGRTENEVPAVGEIQGEMFKGKADMLNHDERLIIDLKTTSDIKKFHVSARRYNYDSQAYIYKQLFGYDMVFVAVDKTNFQVGFYDCSDNFYASGKEKVERGLHAYRLFYKDDAEFDWSNYLITETL